MFGGKETLPDLIGDEFEENSEVLLWYTVVAGEVQHAHHIIIAGHNR